MAQAPAKNELIINLNIAKARDIAVPPMLLTRADDVLAADAQGRSWRKSHRCSNFGNYVRVSKGSERASNDATRGRHPHMTQSPPKATCA